MPAKKISKLKSQIAKPKLKTKKLVKKVVAKKPSVKSVARDSVKKAKAEASAKGGSALGEKIPVLRSAKARGLSVSVYDVKGKIAGHMNLPSEIFNAKINDSLMSQAVRVYLANQRQGTSKTKDRGEIDRTGKKVWQQKGTGRARHGSRRAPIFVGGGVVFGPRPRDFSLNLSKKMKTLALFSALSSKLKDQEIKIVKGLETVAPKTKIMVGVLKSLGINDDKKVLFVIPKAGQESQNVYRASRNIEGINILTANTLNTYKVLDNELILLMKDSIDIIKDTFIKGFTSSHSAGLRGESEKAL